MTRAAPEHPVSRLWVHGGLLTHGESDCSHQRPTDLSKEKMHGGSWGITGPSKAGEVAQAARLPGMGDGGAGQPSNHLPQGRR